MGGDCVGGIIQLWAYVQPSCQWTAIAIHETKGCCERSFCRILCWKIISCSRIFPGKSNNTMQLAPWIKYHNSFAKCTFQYARCNTILVHNLYITVKQVMWILIPIFSFEFVIRIRAIQTFERASCSNDEKCCSVNFCLRLGMHVSYSFLGECISIAFLYCKYQHHSEQL